MAVTLDDGGRKYVYGVGPAYAVAGTSIEVYHTDRLGSVRALTNAAGTVTATYRTDEWGLTTATTGASSQPFSFTGEPRDATGLTYLRTRYYDPDLGRFLTRDMWPGVPAIPQTQNRFSYVSNNPTTHADPSGRFLDTILDVAFIIYDVASLIFGPEKERQGNWLALGADVVGAFIPFVTGGGAVVRAGAHVAEHVDDAKGPIHWLDDAARLACSFTAETLVATPGGPVAISSIEIGDIVLAWDEASGKVVERAVTAVLPHSDDETAQVTIDDDTVTTTPDHPMYTLEAGWIEAGLLWKGAHVLTTTGSGILTGIMIEQKTQVLWDLTVEGAHTFFVGKGRWLVHNCSWGSTPAGRPFTKHYATETGPLRNIPAGAIDQAIDFYPGVSVAGGKTVHYDPINNLTVVTGDGGAIVSARKGKPPGNQMP